MAYGLANIDVVNASVREDTWSKRAVSFGDVSPIENTYTLRGKKPRYPTYHKNKIKKGIITSIFGQDRTGAVAKNKNISWYWQNTEEVGLEARTTDLDELLELIEFNLAKQYYETHREEICSEYLGKYISIINNKVVDFDLDFSELAKRVYSEHGYKTLFITKVTKEPRVIDISKSFVLDK